MFVGKWQLVESENFDELMKALNVGYLVRKMGSITKPLVTIKENGPDGLSIKTESTFKTTDISFKYGEEFDEVTPDGREVKSTITKDADDKITQIQKHEAANTVLVREFSADMMKMTVTAKNVTAIRKYARVTE